MFALEIRRQAEAAPRAALPAITAALWRAYGEGNISEAEAESLSALIETRRTSTDHRIPGSAGHARGPQTKPRAGVGSRPRTNASLERRRRWAASGWLPPSLAARFTLAELAVLSLVAAETQKRGGCRLPIGHLAAVAGVSKSTVRNAVREAQKLGLLTVEERRLAAWRNDSNIIRIISPEWTAWLRLARQRGGYKFVNPTPTQISTKGKTRSVAPTRRPLADLYRSNEPASRTADA
jgi:hypothetical protein